MTAPRTGVPDTGFRGPRSPGISCGDEASKCCTGQPREARRGEGASGVRWPKRPASRRQRLLRACHLQQSWDSRGTTRQRTSVPRLLKVATAGSASGRGRVEAAQVSPNEKARPPRSRRSRRCAEAHPTAVIPSERKGARHGEARSAKPEARRGMLSALLSDDPIAAALLLQGIPPLVARLAARASVGMTG